MEKRLPPEKTPRHLAHVRCDGDIFSLHDLDEHLREVGKLAEEHARLFGSGDWARVAGLWHDLGKYSVEFQRRIKSVSGYDAGAHLEGHPGRVDHSTVGAQYATDQFGGHGRILAYLIAGHHAGLPDWHTSETTGSALKVRLDDNVHLKRTLSQAIPIELLSQPKPTTSLIGGREGFALWVRMLFSCLVDADFLDTEAFMDADKARQRLNALTLPDLLPRFNAYMEEQFTYVPSTQVNRMRAEVLRQCRDKAQEAPGVFSLTIPTGGGKTLSSLAFALEHAALHRKGGLFMPFRTPALLSKPPTFSATYFPMQWSNTTATSIQKRRQSRVAWQPRKSASTRHENSIRTHKANPSLPPIREVVGFGWESSSIGMAWLRVRFK